jgi:hypothetical protein
VPRRNYSDLNAIGAGRGRFAKRGRDRRDG